MTEKDHSSCWKRIVLHVVLPAGLTIMLFFGAIFGLMLPQIKQNFLEQKQQLIQELTGSVYTLVEHYHERHLSGELTLQQAQQRVLERIRAMRYGPEGKDYFWINDLEPVMIMHPYRTDLEGQNVADYPDSEGKLLFIEFINAVQASPEHAGYVDYMWQWKDDESVIVPKLSHVRLYEPWDWVIGTGIYLEDVRAELALITRNLERSFIFILLIVTGISGYLIWHGVCVEIRRRDNALYREQLLKSLAIKNEELESVVYIASHDLRSPLINLQGFSGELEQSCTWLKESLAQPESEEKQARICSIVNEQIPECLGFIRTNAEKMNGLVSGLLRLSRLGVAELKIEPVDANEVLDKVADACNYQLKSLETNLEVGSLPRCKGDYKLVDQVFTNLIDNAMKYRHPDRTPHIRVTGRRLGQMVEYAVADNGIGIKDSDQVKVFDMFHQNNKGGRSDGVGLGLTIVKRIVDMLDGEVRVDSEPDKGTTFTILLPAGD